MFERSHRDMLIQVGDRSQLVKVGGTRRYACREEELVCRLLVEVGIGSWVGQPGVVRMEAEYSAERQLTFSSSAPSFEKSTLSFRFIIS